MELGSNPENVVTLGRIARPFGVRGWVHVYSFTDDEALLGYDHWQLCLKGRWQTFEVLEIKPHGKGCVALLAGISTREEAQTLTNVEMGVFQEEMPELPEGEYYWSDLIGLTVVTETGESLGKVDSLVETGSNDVLIVKNELKEHCIPYLPGDYILEVNLEQKQIRVNWDPDF